MTATKKTYLWLVFLAAGGLCMATTANASRIDLSSLSSEATVAPSVLGASLDFAVTGGDTLTLTVDNTCAFDVVVIFFNANTDVTGLSLDSGPKKWELIGDTTAGGFGSFDYALAVPIDKASKDKFDAGDSAVFVLNFMSNGSVDGTDPGRGQGFPART